MKDTAQTRQSQAGWIPYLLIALAAAALGAGGTWVTLGRQRAAAPTAAATGTAATDWVPVTGGRTEGNSTGNAAGSIGTNSTGSVAAGAGAAPAPAPAPGATPAQQALARANWYYDHKEWAQAIPLYQQAIAQGADNPDVHTDLGSAYRFAGQPYQALQQYHLTQRRNPHHENSLFNQGGLYAFELNDPVKGIAVWREYLARFPQGASAGEARRLIAEAQQHLDHHPAAAEPAVRQR